VFISSTFRDMHAERDHLVKVVFPRLRERLERYRIELVDIDLRWGITEAQANDGRVLELCLQQIDECRPYFVGLLGQRYGWVPTELAESAVHTYGWIRDEKQKSITELEIHHGVLNNPDMSARAFFFFRNELALEDVPGEQLDSTYRETEPLYAEKLSLLKKRIRENGCPVFVYTARWDPSLWNAGTQTRGRFTGLEGFGEAVGERLFSAICTEHGLDTLPPDNQVEGDSDNESDYHERFIHSRLKMYVHRKTIHKDLLQYVHGADASPLLLSGHSGAGKSASLAYLIRSLGSGEVPIVIVSHFVGASPYSTNLRFTLRRLCTLINEQFGLPGEPPDAMDDLVALFRSQLMREQKAVKLLVIIDGLDQFEEMDQPHELYWLPENLAANVRLIVSCNEVSGTAKRAGRVATERRFKQLFLTGLDDSERSRIIQQVPSISAKTLDEQQVDMLMRNPATRNPLFLSVALEELKGFGSFEHLNRRISLFPNPDAGTTNGEEAVEQIFQQVLGRLETDFDAELAGAALCLLACSRTGLSETELGTLTAEVRHADLLFPLLRQLRPYLIRRGKVLHYYYPSLREAVNKRYLRENKEKKQWHRRLADFFGEVFSRAESRSLADALRVVEELPWQLWKTESWENLYGLLSDLDFIGRLIHGSVNEIYLYWSEIEKRSGLRMVNAYRFVIENPAKREIAKRYCGHWKTIWRPYRFITELLIHYCYFREAGNLLEAMMKFIGPEDPEYGYCTMQLGVIRNQTGEIEAALDSKSIDSADPEIRTHDLMNKAVALAVSGQLEESLELFVRCEQMGRQHGLKRITGQALANMAHIYIENDRYDEARHWLCEAEAIARKLGDLNLLGQCLGNQGVISRVQGDLEDALRLHEQQMEICRTVSDKHGLGIAICQHALVVEEMGRTEEAIAAYREAEAVCRETSNAYWLDFSLSKRGALFLKGGDRQGALACFEECERLREKLGNRDELREALELQIDILSDTDLERMVQKVQKLKTLDP
jgi:tetratricopeptide (TPR) repeat protein